MPRLRLVAATLVAYLGLTATETAEATESPARVKATICQVFGKYCAQAKRVAWCESRYHTNARNGQYRGIFQMGRTERRTYGHGDTAMRQAIAAYVYFVVTGRDWSPWECKP